MRLKNRFMAFKNNKPNLYSDKRAVSVALTTLIITAAVVAAGISVLYWAYTWGNIANEQYSQTISNNQNATSERLAFEHTTFSSGKLTVYLINCGQVNDVGVARVYIWDNYNHIVANFPVEGSPIELKDIETDQPILGLDKGQEGYFSIDLNLASGSYMLRVVTERGRNFDTAFVA